MTDKDRLVLDKMRKWANKAEVDYQALRSEFEPSPYSNAAILTAFSLAQIGELSGRVSEELQKQYPDIPWKQIKGMRNLIIHDYTGIDMRIVKDTVEHDIPQLKQQIEEILQNMCEKRPAHRRKPDGPER